MCGIYAIFDKTGKGFLAPDADVLGQMAILTQLRGLHSSGVFAVHKDKPTDPPRILKTLGSSHNLALEKGWDTWWKFVLKDAGVVVGHGRYATVGKVIKANAHPFKHEHITMVHNGTIRGGLDKEHEAEVDSHQLCKQIAADGIREALNKAFGAYAIVVHDDRDGCVYITRNTERPLYYLETPNKVYVLSEEDALSYLYKRCSSIPYGDIKEFEANKLYVFDLASKTLVKEGEPVKKPFVHQPYTHHQYTPPTHTPPPAARTVLAQQMSKLYANGESIEFQVKSIVTPSGGQLDCTYLCLDEDGNTVFFKRRQADASLLEKWGEGTVSNAQYNNQTNRWLYQISNRSIEWNDDPVDGNLVLTVDGEVITKEAWMKTVSQETCSVCKETVSSEDNEHTLVFIKPGTKEEGLGLVCKHCLKEHGADHRNYNQIIQQVMH